MKRPAQRPQEAPPEAELAAFEARLRELRAEWEKHAPREVEPDKPPKPARVRVASKHKVVRRKAPQDAGRGAPSRHVTVDQGGDNKPARNLFEDELAFAKQIAFLRKKKLMLNRKTYDALTVGVPSGSREAVARRILEFHGIGWHTLKPIERQVSEKSSSVRAAPAGLPSLGKKR